MSGPRRNRVDPWGDLHAVATRGMFTGNRGCLVDEDRRLVRHHQSRLWIICRLAFRDHHHELDRPHHWTPLFFLDEAVALAAGHRPCAYCRRADYNAYREAVRLAGGDGDPLSAAELDRRLQAERLGRGRGLGRGRDRLLWDAALGDLPSGTVVVRGGEASLVAGDHLLRFGFDGWTDPIPRGTDRVQVLTPPTSVAALRNGYEPELHPSVGDGDPQRHPG